MDSTPGKAFEGSVIAVLGATGGIGRTLCERLTAEGARLVVGARDRERLEALAYELDARPYRLNASVFEEVEALCRHTLGAYDRLDGIVNCAGSLLLKPAHLTGTREWEEAVTVNLTSAFATVRAAGRTLRERGGSVVLMASAAARIGLPNHEAIGAVKAGVIGLALAAAASYAQYGIRVNALAPGLVRTPLTERITRNEKSAEASRILHPLGRLGEAADVAAAIAWLLSSEQSWVTGQVIGVDGGLATLRARAV